jgi:hypothetical protein
VEDNQAQTLSSGCLGKIPVRNDEDVIFMSFISRFRPLQDIAGLRRRQLGELHGRPQSQLQMLMIPCDGIGTCYGSMTIDVVVTVLSEA